MRKQVDYQYRLLDYSSIEPSKSTAAWSEYVRNNYLSQGWEILATETVHREANTVYVGITFVKYEDVEVSSKSASK